MPKRKITPEDRAVDRQNALKGSEKSKGSQRGKSKYGPYSWGFQATNKGTSPRKHKGGAILSHIFRKGQKNFVLLLKKEKKGPGKQPFTATVLEGGKAQSTLDNQIKIDATSFKEAKIKALKEIKKVEK